MTWLITGGAGFIGSNLADALLADGERVHLVENMSRPGSRENFAWLLDRHPGADFGCWSDDVSDRQAIAATINAVRPDVVVHLAAQVAVTTSLQSPRRDFEVNALGTLNVLEACRRLPKMPVVLFASTNKVYGGMEHEHIPTRGDYSSSFLWAEGVPETCPFDPRTPYGCSKAAADCYVRDYAASFGLPAAAFRLSCVYGPRQHGTADQGWVAHFAHAAARGEPVTIYGDGHQVRDALYVGDLVALFRKAAASPSAVAWRAWNVGGGPANTLTPRRLLDALAARGMPTEANYADWRPGDQRWYVSDTRAITAALGWRPAVGVAEGLDRLTAWVKAEAGEAVPA